MPDKIRLGLIGAGPWAGRAHLPALASSPDFEITAVCTTSPESAQAARRRIGARFAYHDHEAMAASPDIDAVAVVVRVPFHHALARAALAAGKHVYAEWPLGRTTAEAVELAALARSRGLRTAVGLQSRVSPVLMHMKELVASGYVGDVTACRVGLMREGVLQRPSSRSWQRNASQGANTLTIPNGHTIDALRFVAGDFARVACVVSTQVPQWLETDTGKLVDVDAPDNVLVSGRLAGGAVASVHVATIPWAGSGFQMEVYGRRGTLIVTGPDSPQLCELRLRGAQGGNALEELQPPARLAQVPAGTAPGESANVARMYGEFARAIRTGSGEAPTFDTAVELHHLLDAIRQASDTGREARLA